ncbi:MAG: FAD-binding protein [Chloroflexi bacterium]|nr:FAD-binding protein [Chloroflexota bacterium]
MTALTDTPDVRYNVGVAMSANWANWSGSVTCAPQAMATPASEAELVERVRRANGTVRVAGTGHSFVPLCASDGLLLSLDGLQGVVSTDPQTMQAIVWAGTKIHQLGEPLLAAGMAMENMGDIDRQSLAGAISTGTHGTGPALGNIPTQVVGLRLVTASGEVLNLSAEADRDVFRAAQVSLGMLGVISQITLRVLPAYRLHERTWVESFDECMGRLEALIASNRHFEFFWSPREDGCAIKTLNPTQAIALPQSGAAPEAQGRLARYMKPERIDWSYRIFPSERNLRFNELEFAVPEASGPDCMSEVRQLMLTRHRDVIWPVEYRTLAADDIWLSPAYGRATVTLSVHQAAELPHQSFFADAEAVFRNHGGRPHWGKMHSHRARDLQDLYPLWDRFQTVRERLDPSGRFMNDYLRELMMGAA